METGCRRYAIDVVARKETKRAPRWMHAHTQVPILSVLRRRKLGHGLGAFRYGVFREFTGQHETNGRLDFATTERRFFVVRGEFTSLGSDTFKDIVDERIHDTHPLFGNARVGMYLLQHLVNVRTVTFRTLLVLGRLGAGGFGGLSRSGFTAGGTDLGRGLGHGL
jgi:hypothetical protein